MNTDLLDYDDVAEALREGRALRPARGYRIRYAQSDLNFRTVTLQDPIPLGRQILEAAGAEPREDFSLFAILPSGDFEDVRLDEPFDLRQRGAEQFVAFRTDREFKLTLNADQLLWGKPVISGASLYALAEVGAQEAVFLEVRGGADRLIESADLIDLTAPGIERFFTARRPVKEIEIVVNSRPRIITSPHVTYEYVVQLAFPGQHEPNTFFSVIYRHAASKPHAGELGAGGSVEAKNGTIFNVTKTIQS